MYGLLEPGTDVGVLETVTVLVSHMYIRRVDSAVLCCAVLFCTVLVSAAL